MNDRSSWSGGAVAGQRLAGGKREGQLHKSLWGYFDLFLTENSAALKSISDAD